MKKSLRISLGLALMTTAGLASAGFTNAPTFDKPYYFVNDEATLTVYGMGVCKNFVINWNDGQSETVAQHDFSANQNKLVVTHKYTSPKKYFPSVTAIAGQCGSRSTSTEVVLHGKVRTITANPKTVTLGQPVEITVDGVGVCPDAVIRVSNNSAPAVTVSGVFGKDAGWSRKVTFTPNALGNYLAGHGAVQGGGDNTDCFALPEIYNGAFKVVPAKRPNGNSPF